jgi:hypothetical protein
MYCHDIFRSIDLISPRGHELPYLLTNFSSPKILPKVTTCKLPADVISLYDFSVSFFFKNLLISARGYDIPADFTKFLVPPYDFPVSRYLKTCFSPLEVSDLPDDVTKRVCVTCTSYVLITRRMYVVTSFW